MDWFVSQDPIIACSSGTSENTAISVLRISGFKKLNDLQDFFKADLSFVKPRYATFTHLLENSNSIDEVILTYFEGPNSYNGENILELSVHGNPINVRRIIGIFKTAGVREANPGEITYRALRNKKLTMSQVEGLDTLLNANSIDLINEGLQNLGGALQKEYLKLKDLYLNLRGSIEILIDFSDDIGDEESLMNFRKSFDEFQEFLLKLKKRTKTPRSHLLKPKVVLLGETNAGKSTLFNEFLSEKRAIVSEVRGTTRDYISEYFYFSGVEYQVVDTAGIRESRDSIEVEGIKLSKQLYKDAFFKVLVINPLNFSGEINKETEADAVIFTHADSEGFQESLNKFEELVGDRPKFYAGSIGPVFDFGPIEPGSQVGPIGPKPSGPIEPLTPLLKLISSKYSRLSSSRPITPERQRNNINNLSLLMDELSQLISTESDPAILSSEINNLEGPVNSLIGIVTPDQVLNNIFSNFCIGK